MNARSASKVASSKSGVKARQQDQSTDDSVNAVDDTTAAQLGLSSHTDATSVLGDQTPFEEVLARLESVVERLEKGDLALEESLATFEEGIRLSRMGADRLQKAEQRVETLLAEQDTHEITGTAQAKDVNEE